MTHVALAAVAASLLVGGCSKVRPQPPPETPVPPAPAAPAAASTPPRPNPPSFGGGGSPSFQAEAPAPAAPVAAAPPAAPPDGGPGTLNGDPKGLKNDDLQKGVNAAMDRFAGCLAGGGAGTSLSLTFEATPEGRPGDISVKGANLTAATQKCLNDAAGAITFPKFEGKSVTVNVPLAVHSTPPVQPPAAPAAPPAAGTTPPPASDKPPPIFVKP